MEISHVYIAISSRDKYENDVDNATRLVAYFNI